MRIEHEIYLIRKILETMSCRLRLIESKLPSIDDDEAARAIRSELDSHEKSLTEAVDAASKVL